MSVQNEILYSFFIRLFVFRRNDLGGLSYPAFRRNDPLLWIDNRSRKTTYRK